MPTSGARRTCDGLEEQQSPEYFKLANQQAATNIDAYKWSTENM